MITKRYFSIKNKHQYNVHVFNEKISKTFPNYHCYMFKCNTGLSVLLNFLAALEILTFSNIMCHLEAFTFGMFVSEIFKMYINIMI